MSRRNDPHVTSGRHPRFGGRRQQSHRCAIRCVHVAADGHSTLAHPPSDTLQPSHRQRRPSSGGLAGSRTSILSPKTSPASTSSGRCGHIALRAMRMMGSMSDGPMILVGLLQPRWAVWRVGAVSARGRCASTLRPLSPSPLFPISFRSALRFAPGPERRSPLRSGGYSPPTCRMRKEVRPIWGKEGSAALPAVGSTTADQRERRRIARAAVPRHARPRDVQNGQWQPVGESGRPPASFCFSGRTSRPRRRSRKMQRCPEAGRDSASLRPIPSAIPVVSCLPPRGLESSPYFRGGRQLPPCRPPTSALRDALPRDVRATPSRVRELWWTASLSTSHTDAKPQIDIHNKTD